ncbi:MAG: hypothetical protein KJZ47_13895 [Gemmatimonadales bacterium]|nr:hypothetical protein [Gemmatimonadales bacterium]
MGMFDSVYLIKPVPCPGCGHPTDDFQTKDADCILAHLSEADLAEKGVDHFYTSCSKCHGWIAYHRRIKRTPGLDQFEVAFEPAEPLEVPDAK